MKHFAQILWAVVFVLGCSSQPQKPSLVTPPAAVAKFHQFDPKFRNSPEAQRAPYVVMVSIDGFRYDYAERYKANNILDIAAHGVSAKSLIPVFPSKTFPNHYSIITGLYADEHGIVSNEFYNPATQETYNAFKGGALEGKWYGGEPLWVTAEKNGFVSASYFWVASEAPIEGRFPNYYVEFSEQVPERERIDQTVAWLKLPAEERPHFITLYFSGVDHAGHQFGPEAHETAEAVAHVDELIGQLRKELAGTGLPVDLIVVSDHGMETVSMEKIISLEKVDLSPYIVSGYGTMTKLYLKPGQSPAVLEKTIAEVKALGLPARAWKPKKMKALHFSKTASTGDLVIEADAPYYLQAKMPEKLFFKGDHGWNPARFPNLRGIFYAEGPDFQKGMSLPAFENVHIFPMVAMILRFKQLPKVSGRLSVLKPALAVKPSREVY